MATAILAAGIAAASSATVTLSATDAATLSLFPAAGGDLPHGDYVFRVQKQASTGQWVDTGVRLDFYGRIQVISGAGAYRVTRPALKVTGIGVDRD
ncbi:MAG TPA: hypothetical protein VIG97_02305 [Luteimonas sp.]